MVAHLQDFRTGLAQRLGLHVRAPHIERVHGPDHTQREARDARGRWTDTAGSGITNRPEVGQQPVHVSPVASLSRHLAEMGAPPLHEVVTATHWFEGSNSGVPNKPRDKIEFLAQKPYLYHPLDDLYEQGQITYTKEAKKYVDQLSPQERETLRRLTHGDIPAEWGHDPAYLGHLKAWANGSSLVDTDGYPYRLYHGTGATFHSFDPAKRGSSTDEPDAKLGYFFSSAPEDAGFFSFFGMTQKNRLQDTPNILPVHVCLRKPLVVRDGSGRMDTVLMKNAIQYAQKRGYDGVVMYRYFYPDDLHISDLPKAVASVKAADGTRTELYSAAGHRLPRADEMTVVALDPADIKSAIGNAGTFDHTAQLDRSLAVPLLLLVKAEKASSSASKGKHPKTGQKIQYEHPNYPGQVRQGTVLAAGRDGCIVLHLASGHEERVRYEHLRRGRKAALAKSESSGGVSAAAKKQPTQDIRQAQQSRQWEPRVVPLPYDIGHAVEYQRPDMAEPRTGRITGTGRDGALVELSNGARHVVRWPDVKRRVTIGILPEQRQDASQALREMGLPMSHLDDLLTGDRSPKIDKETLARVAALADTGAPIDVKRVAEAHPSQVEQLLHYLTTVRTHDTLSQKRTR